MSIELLDPRNKVDVDAVARLHEAYLPDSPVVKMGPRFLRDFYYGKLIEDELVHCMICRVDSRIAGFIAFTEHPYDFLGRGLWQNRWLLSRLVLAGTMARPATLANVLLVWRILRERLAQARRPETRGMGEALSLAVAPEYQGYVPPGARSRTPIWLFESMVEHFRRAGLERVIFMVQPSNRAPNLFYNALGCRLEKIVQAGMPLHRYTYDLTGPASEAARGRGR